MPSHPDITLSDIAARQHGVFGIVDARTAGLRADQIKRRAADGWIQMHDGVYRAAGAPMTWRGNLYAATLAAGAAAAISHRAAAALYELPGGRTGLVELTCLHWKRTVQPGLVVHESRRLDARDVQLVDGIPVTRPERVILDIASYYPSANYLEIVVQAARRKRLVTYESTREMLDRHARRGLKGVRAMREMLERWDPNSRATESEMETLLVRVLRENGLPYPVVQHNVTDTRGRFVARVDAAYPDQRIVIEYDSKQEHSDEFQIARDARRRNQLQALGYSVLSARHADLRLDGTELCAQIRTILHRPIELA